MKTKALCCLKYHNLHMQWCGGTSQKTWIFSSPYFLADVPTKCRRKHASFPQMFLKIWQFITSNSSAWETVWYSPLKPQEPKPPVNCQKQDTYSYDILYLLLRMCRLLILFSLCNSSQDIPYLWISKKYIYLYPFTHN